MILADNWYNFAKGKLWTKPLYCQKGGMTCNVAYVEVGLVSSYQNCIFFDMLLNDSMHEGTSEGVDNGLTLVLWAENNILSATYNSSREKPIPGMKDIMSPDSAMKGARLTVTEPDQIEGPNYRGVDIPPGMSAIIGLTAKRVLHVGHPYSNCSFTNPEKIQLMRDIEQIMGRNTPKEGAGNMINSTYSQSECRQVFVIYINYISGEYIVACHPGGGVLPIRRIRGAKICSMASQLDTGSPTDLRGITAQQKRGKVPS